MIQHSASPLALLRSFTQHRHLVRQLIRRDITGRYRGSALGMLWSFINPLLLLAMYTFVFAVVFKTRWAGGGDNHGTADFALILFTGLILHGLLAECINRAPGIILANTNFVKKVVFPLEILPLMLTGSALFHACMSFGVLFTGLLLLHGSIPLTALYLPLILLPYLILLLGIGWGLASLGVYLRDIGQLMGLATTLLLFISPVFYSIAALPEMIRPFIYLNPISFIVEQARAIILFNQQPDIHGLLLYFAIALATCHAGFWWFQKTRKGFADIV